MQTFNDVIFDVYLPAYIDLYTKIKKDTPRLEAQQTMFCIARNIKAHDHFVGNHNIIEKCNSVLNSMSTKGLQLKQIYNLLFDLLYALRKELKTFCVEYYPIKQSQAYKLVDHFTWNVTLKKL